MKNLFLAFLLLGVSSIAFSQSHYIGCQAGMNFSRVSSDFAFQDDIKFRPGFTGGLNYSYAFGKELIAGAAILYSQQGFKNEMMFTDENGTQTGTATTDFYYDYMVLPVTFGFNWNIGEKLVLIPKIGLQPGYLLNARVIIPELGSQHGENFTVHSVAKFDLEALSGIELGYKLKPDLIITLEAMGKMSLNTFSTDDYFASSNLRHRLLSFALTAKYVIE